MRRRPTVPGTWIVACLLPLTSCLPDDPPVAPEPTLDVVSVDSGDGQQAPEGETLPIPVVARVVLSDGALAAHYPLEARIVSGNGTISRGGGFASGNGGTLVAQGAISFEWTMGPSTETQQILIFSYEGGDTVRATVGAVSLPAGSPLAVVAGRVAW